MHRGCGHAVLPALASRAGALPRAPETGGLVLDKLCVLCAGMEGEVAELLRMERRRGQAEREALGVLRMMPDMVEVVRHWEKGALEERIRAAEGKWEGAWVACQDVERKRW